MIGLLNLADVKSWIHRDIGQRDKLLVVLASMNEPCRVRQIKERAKEAGFGVPRKWNVSSILARSKGLAINMHEGWEITEAGKQRLQGLGVTRTNQNAAEVATDLRSELSNINDKRIYSFVEEAIKCYEAELYRSAVVMSWIGAVAVLQNHVYAGHLTRFNVEAKRVDSRWKEAKTTDDLSRMGEGDFLDRIAALSIIGKDVKTELLNCLRLRNSCGHPNSFQLGANTVARHIEVLLLNVFTKFK